MSNIEPFHGLIWHLECMALAAEAIENFRPPADGFQMRMHYSLYLTNLMSAIDMVGEACGEPFDAALMESLKTSRFSGAEIHGYLRELRHGVVHRGADPTSGGTVLNDVVWATSPPTVKTRERRKGVQVYAAPAPLLHNIFVHYEIRAKPVIEQFLQPNFEIIGSVTPEAMLADAFNALEAFPHMPDWAKEMARKHITPEMLGHAQVHQVQKMRGLLKPRPGQPLD